MRQGSAAEAGCHHAEGGAQGPTAPTHIYRPVLIPTRPSFACAATAWKHPHATLARRPTASQPQPLSMTPV